MEIAAEPGNELFFGNEGDLQLVVPGKQGAVYIACTALLQSRGCFRKIALYIVHQLIDLFGVQLQLVLVMFGLCHYIPACILSCDLCKSFAEYAEFLFIKSERTQPVVVPVVHMGDADLLHCC